MTTTKKTTELNVVLPPSIFAFGGGTKSLSELTFNKYDTDKNGNIQILFKD